MVGRVFCDWQHTGRSALYIASACGRVEVVAVLLTAGVAVNAAKVRCSPMVMLSSASEIPDPPACDVTE
jgi:hypothetical protein